MNIDKKALKEETRKLGLTLLGIGLAGLLVGGDKIVPFEALLLVLLGGNETRYDLRRDTLASIALHRSDESLAFLLGIIREGTTADALAAVDAFAPFRSDPTIEAQLEEAVTERREAEPDFGRRR